MQILCDDQSIVGGISKRNTTDLFEQGMTVVMSMSAIHGGALSLAAVACIALEYTAAQRAHAAAQRDPLTMDHYTAWSCRVAGKKKQVKLHNTKLE